MVPDYTDDNLMQGHQYKNKIATFLSFAIGFVYLSFLMVAVAVVACELLQMSRVSESTTLQALIYEFFSFFCPPILFSFLICRALYENHFLFWSGSSLCWRSQVPHITSLLLCSGSNETSSTFNRRCSY